MVIVALGATDARLPGGASVVLYLGSISKGSAFVAAVVKM